MDVLRQEKARLTDDIHVKLTILQVESVILNFLGIEI